ncbi:DUF4071 domain-containing protein [Corallococcus exercitus]|uniref:DUF4071 domain-containing protein n=1 Tax=Corallococcus exercitus TaxID=2316736 RepID=A0A7Y4KFP6_9BACT|nr:TRAFs-binding domain-containing protein [Corallococcus exercitus]NOK32024.1 DUF4071 domain-containing protein [Corallococcus exercitus]
MNNSLCFVLMPFGKKPDGTGRIIDFDEVYRQIIAPAISDAGLEPIRADEEQAGGIIHKAMFERLILCAYAVADLTTANANVFYELGVRHAVRPWRTVAMFTEGMRLPFDVNYLRSIPYALDDAGVPKDVAASRKKLSDTLKAARDDANRPNIDSPVFQLLDYLSPVQVAHEKTDLFRQQAKYSEEAKRGFAAARKQESATAVDDVLQRLRPLGELEAGVLIDAMLSFRAVKAWPEMVAFIDRLPVAIRETVMVQEQRGFALNRTGRGDAAEETLLSLISKRGASSETLGILGRVYKDRWEAAHEAGNEDEARALLDKAIETYLKGFDADIRDAYPGVNAVTLMELHEPPDARSDELLPVVHYAVTRKMSARAPDYWDYATLLELAVLSRDSAAAAGALGKALTAVREPWWPESTQRNLRLIRQARARRGEQLPWAEDAERKLRKKAGLDEMLS